MINRLRSFWRGEIELWKSYWFGLITYSILGTIISNLLPENLLLNIFFICFNQPIMIFLWVGVWRSANIYKKSKKKIWAILAQAHIVVGVIVTLGYWFYFLYVHINAV